MDLHAQLKIAMKAAIVAGKEIMEIYGNEDFKIEIKSDNTPITIADKKANDTINELLRQTQTPIISEESKQAPYEIRRDWQQCWIVDPLDGTKEFIDRNGEFTVNIALVENGKPILGVIYVPVKKILYYAKPHERKAYKTLVSEGGKIEDLIGNSTEIKPETLGNQLRILTSRSHLNKETTNFIAALKNDSKKEVKVVPKGSSWKFCLMAEGLADIYPRFGPTMEWDTAAGHAICNAVGIKVTDNKTGKEIKYNRENVRNNSFMVSYIGNPG